MLQLKLIDRKKNLFKLAQGEYVAAEKVENVIIQAPLVAQSFVYGDSTRTFCVAVCVPDEEAAAHWAREHAKDGESLQHLCDERSFVTAVLQQIQVLSLVVASLFQDVCMQRIGYERGLAGYEIVRAIYLTPHPFTAEGGLLTPTFKLKRHEAREHFSTELAALYEHEPQMLAKL
jgi:long-chain acyl-CoA synthetase